MTHDLALFASLVANLGAGMLLTYLATAPLRRLAQRQRVARALAPRPRPLTVPVEAPPLQLPAPSAPIQSHVRRRWS